MPLLLLLARVFIKTFGITQPTPRYEHQTAWFIGATLLLVLLGSVAAAVFFLHIRL